MPRSRTFGSSSFNAALSAGPMSGERFANPAIKICTLGLRQRYRCPTHLVHSTVLQTRRGYIGRREFGRSLNCTLPPKSGGAGRICAAGVGCFILTRAAGLAATLREGVAANSDQSISQQAD
jgi:hypothetical protein